MKKKRVPVSVFMPVRNEAARIAPALASVQWADEIVVLDTGCTDETISIAKRYGARIVQVKFTGFGALRNEGIRACTHDWVLSLDADERCTPALAAEIEQLLRKGPQHVAYWIARRNWFMKRWIRHSGWYPDFAQPKLFRKDAFRYRDDPVHEGWEADGSVGYLKHEIVHFSFRTPEDVLRKVQMYSQLGTAKALALNKRSSAIQAVFRGLWSFFRIYFLRAGFLDGQAGLVIAINHAYGAFFRHLYTAWHLHGWDAPPPLDQELLTLHHASERNEQEQNP